MKERYSISSLLKKPENIGTPEIASQPANIVANVMGMYFFNRHSSHVLLVMHTMITEPAPRNSSALKNACVKT